MKLKELVKQFIPIELLEYQGVNASIIEDSQGKVSRLFGLPILKAY